jgi:hypothetical protein
MGRMACTEPQCLYKGAHFLLELLLLRFSRSQWPRGQRRRSATARLPCLRLRIPPEAWMSVSCDCCVLSGRVLCDLSTRVLLCAVCMISKPQQGGGLGHQGCPATGGTKLFHFTAAIKIMCVLVHNQDLRFDLSAWKDQETRVK